MADDNPEWVCYPAENWRFISNCGVDVSIPSEAMPTGTYAFFWVGGGEGVFQSLSAILCDEIK